jgi:hypothetical protein
MCVLPRSNNISTALQTCRILHMYHFWAYGTISYSSTNIFLYKEVFRGGMCLSLQYSRYISAIDRSGDKCTLSISNLSIDNVSLCALNTQIAISACGSANSDFDKPEVGLCVLLSEVYHFLEL